MGLAHTLFLLHAWRPFLHCPFWSARALLRGLHPGVPGPQTSNRCFQASGPGRQGLPLASSGASTGSALRDSGPPQPHCIHSPNPHGAKGMPLATPVSLHPPWLAPGVSLPLALGPGMGVPRAWNGPREAALAGQGSWVLRATPGEKAGPWVGGKGGMGPGLPTGLAACPQAGHLSLAPHRGCGGPGAAKGHSGAAAKQVGLLLA